MKAVARPQTAALAALAALVALCALVVGLALQVRSEARDNLDDKRAAFARFIRLSPAASAGGPTGVGRAPAAAFIDAPTQGQAAAELQAYLSRLSRAQGAAVVTSGVEGERKGEPEAIRVQATVETSFAAMQTLLYQLEAGTPYLVIESASIQSSGGGGQRDAVVDDPPLRVVFILRGIWRRGTS